MLWTLNVRLGGLTFSHCQIRSILDTARLEAFKHSLAVFKRTHAIVEATRTPMRAWTELRVSRGAVESLI